MLLVVLTCCFSCTESEDALAPAATSDNASKPGPVVVKNDPTKLARVIMYPGTDHKRRWFFYPNGLLKKIALPNGNLIQTFTYDSQQNLVNTVFYGDPFFIGDPYNYTFTYDAAHHLTAANATPIAYDAVANRYTVNYYKVNLNAELLLTSEFYLYEDTDDFGNPVTYTMYGVGASYNTSGNLVYTGYSGKSPDSYQYDNKVNPLKMALLPICRALQPMNFGNRAAKWLEGEYNSPHNVIRLAYALEDPESEVYTYTYNSLNLPVSQTRDSYYFNTVESSYLNILYYYQGDAIPNN